MGVHLPWEAQERGTADMAFLVLHQQESGSIPEQVAEVLQSKIPALRMSMGCTKGGTDGVLLCIHAPDGQQAAEMLPNLVAVPAALS